jgi:SAM-dependent methyltransferase
MNFYRLSAFTPQCQELLAHYDRSVAALAGNDYPYPLRMRDWELCQVLGGIEGAKSDSRILDTGAFNTYLALYLVRRFPRVTASDLLGHRCRKSVLRRLRLAPAKPTEAWYFDWTRLMRKHGVALRSLDLTRLDCADASFDLIISLSVIEHIPAIERALAEMYRVLAPGGKLLITTDCTPEPRAYHRGVRYFSVEELNQLFAPYPVTSPRNLPDFSRENWCYGGAQPIVTTFIEVTKPS